MNRKIIAGRKKRV